MWCPFGVPSRYSSALVPSRIKIVHRRYQGKADLLASRMYISTELGYTVGS